ncbi:TadE/TadG family type IV pilus assembly protein [Sphingomonas sp. ST-64]|uniref:TadE/TadG family type IV pilus assembly protein n=1 Tax=Sphingomonas plantiphila TaxID=3163295 RepID=A0ABW8YRJ2_9SPHN
MTLRPSAKTSARAFMGALRRDKRGNTLAIVAASLIPLAGMVGGGVDISRMYIVKTRLQHACDAGALAGRKQMGGGTWAFGNYAARTAAERFFDANIQASPYGAASVTKTFSESAGKVTGVASATLPMTLMRVFGKTTETLSVTCDAEMRLPNTDVMFVLDTTGSMGSKAVSTDSQTKMDALKSAVKCFYETVARLDTTENCVGGAPSGGTGNTVQIRFGFVPYATNVNVGKLLPTSFMADRWSYQSREPQWTETTTQEWGPTVDTTGSNGSGDSDWGDWSNTGNSCWNVPGTQYNVSGRYEADTSVTTSGNTRTWQTRTYSRYTVEYRTAWSGWSCSVQARYKGTGSYTAVQHTQTARTITQRTFWRWHYGLVSHDVSGLKNGTGWNNTVQLPIGGSGTNRTLTWDGCIEERPTVSRASYSPIPAGAKDLDVDLAPNAADTTTLWGPALQQAIFARDVTTSWNQLDRNDDYTTTDYYNSVPYYCPEEAKKLQAWPLASSFESYVDGLNPNGNTYHDIGLLWGARFLSPTGIFRSENQYTPQGGEIERHLIFMTDGEACTNTNDYAAYGLPWLDRRTTDPNQVPTDGCLTTGTITQQVNARTQAICAAVKNKNITLWVIWFGASSPTIEGMMQSCATPGRYFAARNSTELQNTFKSIADQISQLRLTK